MSSMAKSHHLGPFNPQFDVNQIFRTKMTDALPENIHELVSGRLVVSITEANTMKNRLVDTFQSKEELIDCLICSCFLPAFSSYEVPLFQVGNFIFDS